VIHKLSLSLDKVKQPQAALQACPPEKQTSKQLQPRFFSVRVTKFYATNYFS
jgi:serine protease inhibitor ecotin